MKESKLFGLCFTLSFAFIICPHSSYYRHIGSLDEDGDELLYPHEDLSDHQYDSDEEMRYHASAINPAYSPRYANVPLLHGGGALSGRSLFNRPLVSPGAQTSRSSLKIPRVFGLLDEAGTMTPKLHKSTTTSRTDSKVDCHERMNDVETLWKLVPKVTQKTKNQRLQELAESTSFREFIENAAPMKDNITGSMRNFPSTHGEFLACTQNIGIILEVLEEDYLKLRERVWLLGILKGIQPGLSIQDGALLHSSFQDGSLSRGEFELVLNQNANLAASAVQIWKQDDNQIEDPVILESFERVELYLKLYEYLKATKSSKKSPEFIKIYNTLCQASSPIPKEKILVLVRKCQLQMVHEDIQQDEIVPIYHIMTHLQKHYREVTNRPGDEIDINPMFESVYASLKKEFKYQEKVKPDVEAFFCQENGDIYMENLVAPFIGWCKVDLKHYHYVFASLRAYEDEVRKSNPQDSHNITRYFGQKQDVIKILSKASDHIEGAKEYMNQQILGLENLSESTPEYLHKNTACMSNENEAIGISRQASDDIEGAAKLMKLDIPTLIEEKAEEEETICSICLQEFFDGQCLIQLDCFEKHVYHKDCIKTHIENMQRKCREDPFCPLCISKIHTPLPRRGHIFGYNEKTALNSEYQTPPKDSLGELEDMS